MSNSEKKKKRNAYVTLRDGGQLWKPIMKPRE